MSSLSISISLVEYKTKCILMVVCRSLGHLRKWTLDLLSHVIIALLVCALGLLFFWNLMLFRKAEKTSDFMCLSSMAIYFQRERKMEFRRRVLGLHESSLLWEIAPFPQTFHSFETNYFERHKCLLTDLTFNIDSFFLSDITGVTFYAFCLGRSGLS